MFGAMVVVGRAFPPPFSTETMGYSAPRDPAADGKQCALPPVLHKLTLCQFKELGLCRPHPWVEETNSSFSLTQALVPTTPPKLKVLCNLCVAKRNGLFSI